MARKAALRKQPLFPASHDLRDYLHQTPGMGGEKRPTAAQIAVALGLSLNRAQTLIKEGLTSEDVITLARYYGLNPVTALADFGFITEEDIHCVTNDSRAAGEASPQCDTNTLSVEAHKQENATYRITLHEFCKALEMLGQKNITLTINPSLD